MDFEWQSRNGPIDATSPWNRQVMENRKRGHIGTQDMNFSLTSAQVHTAHSSRL
jgi:hypothetical protein